MYLGNFAHIKKLRKKAKFQDLTKIGITPLVIKEFLLTSFQ